MYELHVETSVAGGREVSSEAVGITENCQAQYRMSVLIANSLSVTLQAVVPCHLRKACWDFVLQHT
jgi:hypothetical protein